MMKRLEKLHKDSQGFTLVELMIVVAIIGILAAIAVPNFMAYQYRAKRAEVPTNLQAIKTSQESYRAEFNTYVACAAAPAAPGVGVKVAWPVPAAGFDLIGWAPSGLVFGSYSAVAGAAGIATSWTGTGTSDVDGDGALASYSVSNTANVSMTTANNVY